MKSRIANQGPLLTLVVQVSRKGLYVPSSLLQQGLSVILGLQQQPKLQQQHPMFPEAPNSAPNSEATAPPPTLAVPLKHCRQQPTLLVFQHISAI